MLLLYSFFEDVLFHSLVLIETDNRKAKQTFSLVMFTFSSVKKAFLPVPYLF